MCSLPALCCKLRMLQSCTSRPNPSPMHADLTSSLPFPGPQLAGFPQLYFYMLAQRRKVLRSGRSSSASKLKAT